MSNPYEPPESSDAFSQPLSHSAGKRNCLLFLLAWSVVFGAVYGIADIELGGPLTILDAIVFVVATITWTRYDAAEHDFDLWRYFVVLMVICPGPFLVMPVYFVKSRGWSSGLLAFLVAVGFFVLITAVDAAATYVAFELYWGG